MGISRHAIAFGWLHEQLDQLLTHPTAAPAASLPREQLQELFRLAESLQPKMDALCSLCNMVGCMPGASPPLEAEVRDVFVGVRGGGATNLGVASLAGGSAPYVPHSNTSSKPAVRAASGTLPVDRLASAKVRRTVQPVQPGGVYARGRPCRRR